ncbi:MAG: PP2C family protein-serine/threonine phosphatase [Vicinamibacteria bacterium]
MSLSYWSTMGIAPSPTASSHLGLLPRILIADDQADVRLALHLLLKGGGYRTECVDSPEAVLAALEHGAFDLLLMDLNYARDTTSGTEGLALLPRIRAVDPSVAIVVMTAWATIHVSVEAMRRGASDFVLKPWDNAALLGLVRAQLEERARRIEAQVAEPGAPRPAARDLALARRVQSRLLPQTRPSLLTLECAGSCVQAGAVGGDAYDFIPLGPGRLAFSLADASGKGIAAALLMANLQASVRSIVAPDPADLASALRTLNALFLASTAPEHYATLFLGIYDDESRRLRYANCGHNPPVLLRANGSIERLEPTAPVVGLLDEWSCETAERRLSPGDTLLVFSDGVTEARDDRGEEFGEGRLMSALAALATLPVAAVPAAISATVEAFAGGHHEDDLTLLVARAR